MPKASISRPPSAASTSNSDGVNDLTLTAMLELNYQLRSRAATDAAHGGAEALAVDLTARMQHWLDAHASGTPDVPLVVENAKANASSHAAEPAQLAEET